MTLTPASSRTTSGGGGSSWSSGGLPMIHTGAAAEFPWYPLYGGAGYVSANIEVASRPLAYPFRLALAQTIAKLGIRHNASITGNFDVGIYDTSWNRLVSTGSTARNGTSSIQWVTVTSTPLVAGDYYLVIDSDTLGGGTTMAIDPGFAQLLAMCGCMEHGSTVFPLPATLTTMTAVVSFTKIHEVCMAKAGATV